MALTKNQRLFVEEYLVDLNATQAAIRAGYKAHSAHAQGYRLLDHKEVQKAIQERMDDRAERTQVTVDRVIKELAAIGFQDPRKIIGENGDVLPPHEWPDDVAAAVSSIEVTSIGKEDESIGRVSKVRFWDKGKHLEMLGKHLKMFTDKHEHSGGLQVSFNMDYGDADD